MSANTNGDRPDETGAQAIKQRWRVVVGWALVGVGVLLLVLGWFGVSGEPDVARQLSYLASGGLGGLTAAVVGVGFLISEDLRSERSRLGRIEATLLDVSDQLAAQASKPARRGSRSSR